MLKNLKRDERMKPVGTVVRLTDGRMEVRGPGFGSFGDDLEEAYLLIAGLDDYERNNDGEGVLVRVEFMDAFRDIPSAILLKFLCEIVFPQLVKDAYPKHIAIYSGDGFVEDGYEDLYFCDFYRALPGFQNLLHYLEKCESTGKKPHITKDLVSKFKFLAKED